MDEDYLLGGHGLRLSSDLHGDEIVGGEYLNFGWGWLERWMAKIHRDLEKEPFTRRSRSRFLK